MRLKFSPRKRERRIFMGTLLPEERKARDFIADVIQEAEADPDIQEEHEVNRNIRRKAGL